MVDVYQLIQGFPEGIVRLRLAPKDLANNGDSLRVAEKLSNGRSYKMLTILDDYTCEALHLAVWPKMNANDVLDALHLLFMKHSKPEFIRSDNCPQFIANNLQDWLKTVGIKPMQIYPGSPWECGGIRKHCGTIFSQHLV